MSNPPEQHLLLKQLANEILTDVISYDKEELNRLVKTLADCLSGQPSCLCVCAIAQLTCELSTALQAKDGAPPQHILYALQLITHHLWLAAYAPELPAPGQPLN